MSDFITSDCACGSRVISVTPDEDDIRIAQLAHNETPRHQEWRAVQVLKERRGKKGPCICHGGEDRVA